MVVFGWGLFKRSVCFLQLSPPVELACNPISHWQELLTLSVFQVWGLPATILKRHHCLWSAAENCGKMVCFTAVRMGWDRRLGYAVIFFFHIEGGSCSRTSRSKDRALILSPLSQWLSSGWPTTAIISCSQCFKCGWRKGLSITSKLFCRKMGTEKGGPVKVPYLSFSWYCWMILICIRQSTFSIDWASDRKVVWESPFLSGLSIVTSSCLNTS